MVRSEDEITSKIALLFARELGVDEVGLDTHFIFTGGDSLNAEAIVAAVAAEFAIPLKTAVLLDAPTPRAMAQLVIGRLVDGTQA